MIYEWLEQYIQDTKPSDLGGFVSFSISYHKPFWEINVYGGDIYSHFQGRALSLDVAFELLRENIKLCRRYKSDSELLKEQQEINKVTAMGTRRISLAGL